MVDDSHGLSATIPEVWLRRKGMDAGCRVKNASWIRWNPRKIVNLTLEISIYQNCLLSKKHDPSLTSLDLSFYDLRNVKSILRISIWMSINLK